MEIFGINVPVVVICCGLLLYMMYRYSTRNFDLFKKQGIPGATPYPIIGTNMSFWRKGMMVGDVEARQKYGKLYGSFQGSRPMLMVGDTNLLKQVLVKEFNNFQNRQRLISNDLMLDNILNAIQDEHWKHVRNHLTPAFSGCKLRRMVIWINKAARNFRDNLGAKAESGEAFDLKQSAGEFTMDVIAGTGFNLDVNSKNDPNNKFVQMGRKAFSFFDGFSVGLILFLVCPGLVKYMTRLGYRFFPRDVTEFFADVINQAMNVRKESTEKQPTDFLGIMMEALVEVPDDLNSSGDVSKTDFVKEESGLIWSKTGLTRDDVLAQSFIFFIAGYETTALTLGYLGYNLALNPDIQDKLCEEIDGVVGDNDEIDYDMAKRMPYLDMCIDETLRIYPAAVRMDRVCSEDITLNGIFIPKDTIIGLPFYAIHHDPELWEDPEQFIPERFTPDAKEARDPFTYMPFGMGPRNCVGMRLAMMELRIAAAHVLRRYKFVRCEKTEVPIKMKVMSCAAVNGVWLRLAART